MPLNGAEIIDNVKLPGAEPKGPIALQHHGDSLQFRNIYSEEIKPEASDKCISRPHSEDRRMASATR